MDHSEPLPTWFYAFMAIIGLWLLWMVDDKPDHQGTVFMAFIFIVVGTFATIWRVFLWTLSSIARAITRGVRDQ